MAVTWSLKKEAEHEKQCYYSGGSGLLGLVANR